MDDVDELAVKYPFQAMVLGAIVKITLMAYDRQAHDALNTALGREPGFKDCLRYLFEKGEHDEMVQEQVRRRHLEQEAREREAIRRLARGHPCLKTMPKL